MNLQNGIRKITKPITSGVFEKLPKRKFVDKKIIAFDSEDDSKGNVLIFNFYDGKKHYSFNMLEKTSEDVIKWIYSIKESTIFIAHNLEYDIINLFREVKYIYIDEMNYTSRLMSVRLKKCKHIFWDSMNFYATNLRKIGEVIGQKKGDYLEARSLGYEDNLKYCRQDCKILYDFISQFKIMLKKDGVQLSPTIGKMSMDSLRTNFLKRNYGQFSTPECLDSFYGGRTECFFIGAESGKIEVPDVNSMYPDAMTKDFPDTGTMRKGTITEFIYGIGKFKIHVPGDMFIPPLPYRYEKRLWFPTGDLVGWWTYAEVRNALEHGCTIIKEYEGFGTNISCRPFETFVLKNYALRKAPGTNEFEDTYYKLFLNNCYGKTVQHNIKNVMMTKKINRKKKGNENAELIRFLDPFFVYKIPQSEVTPTSNYLWGAYVTSYARIKLFKGLTAIHESGNKILYCDTDSAFYKAQNSNVPLDIGKNLGQWGIDHYCKVDIQMSKGYRLYSEDGSCKVACKGVPNQPSEELLNTREEFLVNGKTTVRKPVKLRESFIQKLRGNVWREVDKEMRTLYNKRRLDKKTGITYPHDVSLLPQIVIESNFQARNKVLF